MAKGMFTQKPDKKLAAAHAKKMKLIDDVISSSVPELRKETLFDFSSTEWLSVEQMGFLCHLYNICYMAWDVDWRDAECKRNLWLTFGNRYPVRKLNPDLLLSLVEHHLRISQEERDKEPFVEFTGLAYEMMRGSYESMCARIGVLFTDDNFWRSPIEK